MALLWFGDKLFAAAGLPQPAWHTQMVENKTQVMIGLMVLSNIGPMVLGIPR